MQIPLLVQCWARVLVPFILKQLQPNSNQLQ